MLLFPREMLHSRHAGGLRSAHPRATYPHAAHPWAAFPLPGRQTWRGRGAGVARALSEPPVVTAARVDVGILVRANDGDYGFWGP